MVALISLVVFGQSGNSGAAASRTVSPFDYYSALVRAAGGTVNRDGRATVLGLRGLSIDGVHHDTVVTDAFDDTFVVLSPDGQVTLLAGSTHPWQIDDPYPLDVDHDGRPDVGMIEPGRYLAISQGIDVAGAPSYYLYTEGQDYYIPGWENTDHDDRYSDEEKAASTARGDTLVDVLFHSEGDGAPHSIGCQVLGQDDMVTLANLVGDSFDYVLIDAPTDLFGSIDVASTTAQGDAVISGWALNLKVDGPVTVHAYVDGHFAGSVTANRARADVGQAFAVFDISDRRGFTIETKPGNVCLYLIDELGGPNPLLGCRDVGTRPPIGSLDLVARTASELRLAGWADDLDAPASVVSIHVYIDGTLRTEVTADRERSDVAAVYPPAGPNHGFDTTVDVAPDRHQVCVYAINTGPGANPLIACEAVDG